MLEKVIENWTSRLDYIRASRGSPMPEIIFKITDASHRLNLDQLHEGLKRSGDDVGSPTIVGFSSPNRYDSI
ncbi:hypothetical protein TNCV_4604941 [Trichonephila clavipes]|nr:hypothetical protein TNCV_4604941 [Trichonephila clavipes]